MSFRFIQTAAPGDGANNDLHPQMQGPNHPQTPPKPFNQVNKKSKIIALQ